MRPVGSLIASLWKSPFFRTIQLISSIIANVFDNLDLKYCLGDDGIQVINFEVDSAGLQWLKFQDRVYVEASRKFAAARWFAGFDEKSRHQVGRHSGICIFE